MVRTQIQLTEEQARALHRKAADQATSVARLIRDAVDASLAVDGVAHDRQRALGVIGRFRSGLKDVSAEHDRYLTEDFR